MLGSQWSGSAILATTTTKCSLESNYISLIDSMGKEEYFSYNIFFLDFVLELNIAFLASK